MTGGVSRFWSKWILGKFDRGWGYVFDLMFVVLCNIVMCGLALLSYVTSLCVVLCSFEKFSICRLIWHCCVRFSLVLKNLVFV